MNNRRIILSLWRWCWRWWLCIILLTLAAGAITESLTQVVWFATYSSYCPTGKCQGPINLKFMLNSTKQSPWLPVIPAISLSFSSIHRKFICWLELELDFELSFEMSFFSSWGFIGLQISPQSRWSGIECKEIRSSLRKLEEIFSSRKKIDRKAGIKD